MIVRVSLVGAEAALRGVARTWPQSLAADLERELASQPRSPGGPPRDAVLADAIARLRRTFRNP